MATLFTETLNLARILGKVYQGTATGGSTTTMVDSTLEKLSDQYSGGTIWILSGTYANTTGVITSYNADTVTFTPAVAGAIIAGVRYAIAPPDYPLNVLRMCVNLGLQSMGNILQNDVTTLVDSDVDQYTLPTGVYNVKRVEFAAADSAPYGYQIDYNWHEAGGVLYFTGGNAPQNDGKKMRIWYVAPHAELTTDGSTTGTVNNVVDTEWLKWAGAVSAYRNRMSTIAKDDPVLVDLMNEALRLEQKYASVNRLNDTQFMRADPRLSGM